MFKLNKRAQAIDTEIIGSPMFVLLALGSMAATVIGYFASLKMNMQAMPLWNLVLVLAVELVASYFFAWKMAD